MMKNRLLSKNNLAVVVVLATLFTFDISTNVFAEPEIEQPIYVEAEEHLMRIIDKQQAHLVIRQEDLERYDDLDSELVIEITTDLSDISTRVLEAEGKLSSLNEDNYEDLLNQVHSSLFQINNDLKDLTEEHRLEIKAEVTKQYLDTYTQAVTDSVELYTKDEYSESFSNLDDITEVLDELDETLSLLEEDPFSQADWIRLEENLKELQELTQEEIDDIKEELDS